MENIKQLKDNINRLRLSHTAENLDQFLNEASAQKPSYTQFLLQFTQREIEQRNSRAIEIKLKKARLPKHHDLDQYDSKVSNGLDLNTSNSSGNCTG